MEEHRKDNRRQSRRVSDPLPVLVFWTGNSGRHAADMRDISSDGCYLNTSGSAEVGELVTVEIPESIDSDVVISISGTVIPQERKHVGFAIHFDSKTDQQQAFIAELMARAPEVPDRRDKQD